MTRTARSHGTKLSFSFTLEERPPGVCILHVECGRPEPQLQLDSRGDLSAPSGKGRTSSSSPTSGSKAVATVGTLCGPEATSATIHNIQPEHFNLLETDYVRRGIVGEVAAHELRDLRRAADLGDEVAGSHVVSRGPALRRLAEEVPAAEATQAALECKRQDA